MGLRRIALVVVSLAFAAAASAAVNPALLPLGDGKYATTAKRGYVQSCMTSFHGGGAFRDGPWIAGSTWDLTKKINVGGTVRHAGTFAARVAGSRLVLSGNGLPSSPTGIFPVRASDKAFEYDRNPNTIAGYTLRVSLPANPKVAARPTCVGGTVGMSTLGVPFYSSFDAGGRDAPAHEVQDACGGHPQMSGQYHFHSLPPCWKSVALSRETRLVGWALDGFGIYVEYDAKGRMLSSANLDVCHGHTSAVTWRGKRVPIYHYVATLDFPYLVGCYRGTPIASATGLGIGGP